MHQKNNNKTKIKEINFDKQYFLHLQHNNKWREVTQII